MAHSSRSKTRSVYGRLSGFESLEGRRLLAPVVMSEREQLLVELVNRARASPAIEAARFGIDLNEDLEPGRISPDPKQPLAPHQALVDAARGHALDMLDREFFEHVNPDGDGPSDRARAAGYPAGAGENIAWFGSPGSLERTEEVYRRHEALFLSESHRTNMLNPGWREIGNAIEFGVFEVLTSIMIAENFGNRGGDNFITGVVYTDRVEPDDFFTVGEAIGSAAITATRVRDGKVFRTTSGPAGGYGLEVPTGVYTVTATSRRFSGTLTVSNVTVLGENIKVDFNSRKHDVGRVGGVVFEDLDQDGRHDDGERPIVGRTIYLDANRDGEQSPDEWSTVTNNEGRYSFPSLQQGVYQLRQVLDAGWRETVPASGVRQVVLAAGQNRTSVGFGSYQFNQPPVAMDDNAVTEADVSVRIDAFSNDSDPDGSLIIEETQVFQAPEHGKIALDSSSRMLVYTPDDGFVGTDTVEYGVTDELGLISEPATVTITVSESAIGRWQNASNELDVNDDQFVSSIDALLILNSLSVDGPRRLPFPDSQNAPPPYLDVNGDAFVSPLDALLVLNEINRIALERRQAQDTAEGEPASVREARTIAPPLLAAAIDVAIDDRTASDRWDI